MKQNKKEFLIYIRLPSKVRKVSVLQQVFLNTKFFIKQKLQKYQKNTIKKCFVY